MNCLIRNHTPLLASYDDREQIVYVAPNATALYININSLCQNGVTFERWRRTWQAMDFMEALITNSPDFKSVFADRSTGTWVCLDVFEQFGNWHGEKCQQPLFGSVIREQIPSLYHKKETLVDPFFMAITVDGYRHMFRAHRQTGLINLSDILTAFNKDIRHWKRTGGYRYLIEQDPDAVDSSNQSTDEFKIRTSYGTCVAALELLDWCNRRSSQPGIVGEVTNFINQHIPPNETIAENESADDEVENTDDEVENTDDEVENESTDDEVENEAEDSYIDLLLKQIKEESNTKDMSTQPENNKKRHVE